MEFQKCRYNDKIVEIPVRYVKKNKYLFLQDVHDYFIGIRRFTIDKELIEFEQDNNNQLIYPQRIPASTRYVIDCHTSMSSDSTISSERNVLNIVVDNMEIIKTKLDVIQRQIYETAEYTIPHLFIVLPVETPSYNPSKWLHYKYRLHFLCDCANDNERHFALHDGYEIKEPREFFQKYGPYLRKTLTVIKYMASVGSIAVPQLSSIFMKLYNINILQKKEFWNNIIHKVEQADEILAKAQTNINISTERNIQEGNGPALRQIRKYLKKVDENDTLGNLYRTVTSNGQVRWVCIDHYNKQHSTNRIKQFRNEFERLGGKIEDNVVIIDKLNEKVFLKINKLLNQGLTIDTISINDVKITEDLFSKFLNIISRKIRINKLKLENIFLTNFRIKTSKQKIISMLNDTLESNRQLIIEYTFTKLIDKFQSKFFDTIKETNSRLKFTIQPEEIESSFKLFGTNETGFVLSLESIDEKSIKNIFQQLNISTLNLQNADLSDNLWNTILTFAINSRTLEEITIDYNAIPVTTPKLIFHLCENRNLKTLHMKNVQMDVCEKIFRMLKNQNTLETFSLTSSTYHLEIDFSSILSENDQSMLASSVKWRTNENNNMKIITNLLQIIPVQQLTLELVHIDCDTTLKQLAETINQLSSLKILELKNKTDYAIFYQEKRIFRTRSNVLKPQLLPAQVKKPSLHKRLRKSLSFLSCISPKCSHSSQIETTEPVQSLREIEVSDQSFSQSFSHPLYKHIQEIALNFTLKQLQININRDINISHLASDIESNSTVSHLRFAGQIRENDMTTLIKAVRKNTIISHLSLREIEISFTNLRQIFDVFYDNQNLNVLEIHPCTSDTDRELFQQEINKARSENRTLQVLF
ncbi:hypothetical protein I4U23_021965 [Adineta vaga]|nr:hypothetical protein I4U23_021965 [Adineta vaga]